MYEKNCSSIKQLPLQSVINIIVNPRLKFCINSTNNSVHGLDFSAVIISARTLNRRAHATILAPNASYRQIDPGTQDPPRIYCKLDRLTYYCEFPYFFAIGDRFYLMSYQILNTDPNAVGERSSATYFTPAHSYCPQYDQCLLHLKSGSPMFAIYNMFPEIMFVSSHTDPPVNILHPLIRFNSSSHAIGWEISYQWVEPPLGVTLFSTVQYFGDFSSSYNQQIFRTIEPTVRSFEIFHSFKVDEKIYAFGKLTLSSLNVSICFVSQLSNIIINQNVDHFNYKELRSISFHPNYGEIQKVRFVNSPSLMSNASLSRFSSLIAVSYYRYTMRDRIVVIPFNLIINDFERQLDGCDTTDNFWDQNIYTRCLRIRDAQVWMIRSEFAHMVILNVLNGTWTRIIDFVPLALDATPGYVFLVLSSDSFLSIYRYSVHFLDENYAVTHHPIERVFNHRNIGNVNRAVSQIYYYGINHPRVIININQYSYTESIILCPFLLNSCLDCFTTQVYDRNGFFFRYCQWQASSLTSGICSIPDSQSPERRNGTFIQNPCFNVTNVRIVNYRPNRTNFNLTFNLIGFHSRYADIFPLTITLVHVTIPSIISRCSPFRYDGSTVYINCDRVDPDAYRLHIVMPRRQSASLVNDRNENLYTYSYNFKTEGLNRQDKKSSSQRIAT
ncbi:uncharacterized protein LOC128389180 [Panonychus citri]|uniref:uncharacterized protein LOC128389180 n=1 Tax=Panonychus citri TaxID=50023 RepID=UPI0023081F72|nr:uncharacterized protein LOC128389180 [Panonychus citri]